MRKLITGILTIALLFASLPVHASLYQYYQERDEALPSISDRASIAAELGIFQYRGTAAQNELLEKRLRETAPTDGIGFSVVSRYSTTLASSMTSNQDTIPVSSLVTFDGHTLTMADLGSVVYLVAEAGTVREEIIKCTAITSGRFASCTRGLAFYGTSEAAVPANQKSHGAGTSIIMSNTHYVYENLVDKDTDQTLSGAVNFYRNPTVTSTATLYNQVFNLGQATSTFPDFTSNQTISGIKTFTNGVVAGGTNTFTGTVTVPYNTASSSAASVGLVNDTANAGAATAATTTKGIAKLSVDPVDPANPVVVGENDPRFIGSSFGDGSDGDVTIASNSTTTLTRDMYYDNLTVNGTLVVDGYKVYVRDTIDGNGTIKAPDPVAAVGEAPAAVSGTGPLRGVAGSAGATTPNGQAGVAGTAGSIGSAGAAGGNGGNASSNGGGDGGIGGTITSASRKIVEKFHAVTFGHISSSGFALRVPAGAGSGGKGNGAGVSPSGGNGGAGGSSGGIVWIAAYNWAGSFTIRAVGGVAGNGSDGSSGGGSAGGGGGGAGGNGGIALTIYATKTWSGSYTLTAGAAGTGGADLDGGGGGANPGSSGTSGNAGSSYEFKLSELL